MKIKSLGHRTNLIFSKFSGELIERDGYLVIKTQNNPGYHWGNFIIFENAPQVGDLDSWRKIFDSEFSYYKEPHHYTYTWNEFVEGDCVEFVEAGYEFEKMKCLTTQALEKPKHYNSELEMRPIVSDQDWELVIQNQVACAEPKYMSDYYIDFKRASMKNYRTMSESGRGHWFGTFVDGKVVGDLGVFFERDLARYQSVVTHPDYRRQGICGSLVHFAGQYAFDNFGVQTLVMEADPNYHAAKIYESVGFKSIEEQTCSLSWWKGSEK